MKATAIAPSNLAFIKYWGLVDEKLRIPTNGSISMNLSNLTTTTTVQFSANYKTDDITINGKKNSKQMNRVVEHLNRIRKIKDTKIYAKVVSKNNFPTSTGLSSSASGFAALTLAAGAALDIHLSEKELSILARHGSGSACRSIPGGFVEWHKGTSSDTSYAETIYPPDWWDIVDIVVCVSIKEKTVPTTKGQTYAFTSPFFKERLNQIDDKIRQIKQSIHDRNFIKFGEIIEQEALELHNIMKTSTPSLTYMLPETITVINKVMQLRKEGMPIYFSLNTGQNVHILCQKENAISIKKIMKQLTVSKEIILNDITTGAQLDTSHLF